MTHELPSDTQSSSPTPQPSHTYPTPVDHFNLTRSAATQLAIDLGKVLRFVVVGDDSEKTLKTYIETSVSPSLLWTVKLTLGGASAGFVSGAGLRAHTCSLQFLAENSHRLPHTVGGWFFYHRYKQLAMIKAGGIGGVRYAGRFAFLSAVFGTAEHMISKWVTETEIFVNALGAGLITAAIFTQMSGLSRQASRRGYIYGGVCGAAIGLLEDTFALLNGYSIKTPRLSEFSWKSYLDGSRWFGESK
ncbi:hypothetical protein BASA50_000945 [Batrachochytrium salamandrivorans]|uniref:Uncharacterized protein n=1 Tax=Batrachochytrium salamandrivorans TaxID=1357716 RepID=A0ABQ8EVC5_9FUNG|nr:hypothetical protein BASA62_000979 [Batrachochytrium salamandrivorans]KAH6582261.1 hypothetical protein BASA60_002023 [Batrachochytrium salamandrivorans]KAH6586002.1 hypothetical protein BASA50_000945 [Batrachochytrium salamandrivorans]KAH6595785.1 hypothetical protein BASA61_003672 [Batrachochytrium salamandrivorans]KAH9275681.1 hypothetical protein BASA83_001981 [Batrachochytrium salamandrivorans]